MSRLPFKLIRKLRTLASNHLKPFCVLFDKNLKIAATSGESGFFGFADLSIGDDARERFPFLVDLELTNEIRLPFVNMQNGHAAHIEIFPEPNHTFAIFIDATQQRDQQQVIQQKANELKLLTYRQERLMETLKMARDDLAIKRRQAEEASLAKGRFISGMSHEFRTPLTSILGYVELMRMQNPGSRPKADHLNALERSARYLLSLIENVLDEARLESEELLICPASTDLNSLANDLSSIFASLAAQKHLEFRLDKNVPQRVELDGVRLRQVLINLLGNAIKFTEKGAVTLELHWQRNRLEALVSDTGSGIPPEQLEKIFSPFHRSNRSNNEGAGLGLAISKQLIELMGGRLSVESQINLGSRFRFSIPAIRNERGSAAEPTYLKGAAPYTSGKGRVLLAEDNEDIVRLFELFLTDAGYDFISTKDGEQAVHVVLQERPDIVFMDLNLPVLNGLEATERLRNARFLKPIIALTASPSKGDRQRALKAGCTDYLLKPVDMSRLLAVTHEFISEKYHAVRRRDT
jgi:signal transduction histidine kinase/ActR/RegA family two-component response regulator